MLPPRFVLLKEQLSRQLQNRRELIENEPACVKRQDGNAPGSLPAYRHMPNNWHPAVSAGRLQQELSAITSRSALAKLIEINRAGIIYGRRLRSVA
jgi:hypothetical protein